jgi:predicted metal-dependent peptidase
MENLGRELEKGHMALMRHPETGFYSGVILLGKSELRDNIPTAYTNGRDKYYGKKFMGSLKNAAQRRFVQLHENKHVADKHMIRFRDLMKEDAQLANAAMDYAINDEIMCIKDKSLVEMPTGPDGKQAGLYDPKFHNWSVREIYRFLKSGHQPPPPKPPGGGNQPPPPGGGCANPPRTGKPGEQNGPPKRGQDHVRIDGKDYPIGAMDEHDEGDIEGKTPEEIQEIERKIDEAIRQGALLAGVRGVNVPRGMVEAITPEIDWRSEFADFITSHIKGNDEYTWRQYDRRRIADDYYLPSTYSEKMTELVVAIDLSGSIGDNELKKFVGALLAASNTARPDTLRVLWWDTNVNSEQKFENYNYDGLLEMLKPRGGGGTYVTCVAKYIEEHKINPDCVVVFTDGYVEGQPDWSIDIPTLWLVTENERFDPPKGQKVKVNK